MSFDNFKQENKDKNIFEERIKALRKKGKKRGKRYSFIGIFISLLIFIVSLISGYIVFEQVSYVFNKMNYANEKNSFQRLLDPEGRCKGNNCCLASIEKMRKKKFKEADENGKCAENEIPNSLKCEASLIWCEPANVQFDINNNFQNLNEKK